jgi:hypothetical protein
VEVKRDISAALADSGHLVERILDRLRDCKADAETGAALGANAPAPSCVMLLLGPHTAPNDGPPQPCLILNKRSLRVRQPGDLCCPGGGIAPRLDTFLARLLRLPASPLVRWPHWRSWRRQCAEQSRWLALRLATGMRECLEEMRLNPLGIQFLGPLPPQRLVMFRRVIYPMAGWVSRQRRFYPNWEVERVVKVPLKNFFDENNYGCYRLSLPPYPPKGIPPRSQDFPCFIHRSSKGIDVLWGATYRIVATFLESIFDFTAPAQKSLPLVFRKLDESYYR